MFGIKGLEFNSDSLIGFGIDSQMDFSKRARINFVIESESLPDEHFNNYKLYFD